MGEEPENADADDQFDVMVDIHEMERRALSCCPSCGSKNIRRSHTDGIVDKLAKLIGRHAYRCRDCRNRFRARRSLIRS